MNEAQLETAAALPQIPGYRIVRRLGEGGMADVYLAVQLSLQRHVAIKVLSFEKAITKDLAERFEREARTIARLDHPNVVGIHEVGRAGEVLYYTMPFLPNGDLSQRDLRDDPRRIVEVLRSVCEALKYAHAHGVVHRDVKPANILFDKTERVLLADFGIAISTDFESRVTTQDKMLGSTGYMSPEQARRQDLDGRADLYSLGVVCYELLTGELPFHGADALSVAIAHMQDPIPRLPPTRRVWQPLIDRALAKQPEQRFQNAGEMLVALAEIEEVMETGGARRRPGPSFALLRDPRARTAFGAAALALAAIWLAANVYERTMQGHASTRDSDPAAAPADGTVEITDAAALDAALADGYALLRAGKLYEPEGDNAASRFLALHSSYPNNPEARAGLDAVVDAASKAATAAIARDADAEARALSERTYALAQASMIPDYASYAAFERAFAATALERLERGIGEGDRELASRLRETFELAARTDGAITERLKTLAEGLITGARIQDPGGPVLAYVPAAHDGGRLPAFSIGIREVTKGEYAAFARATSRAVSPCGGLSPFKRPTWREPGFAQRSDEPVVCVSANDAQAYARWLSGRTGSTYRLPTRAEWLLLAKDATPRSNICARANVLDASTGRGIPQRWDCNDKYEHTAPVGRFPATALGVHDLVGNVREWVQDCAARGSGETCAERVVLGSSWYDGARRELVAADNLAVGRGAPHTGFRLVREFER